MQAIPSALARVCVKLPTSPAAPRFAFPSPSLSSSVRLPPFLSRSPLSLQTSRIAGEGKKERTRQGEKAMSNSRASASSGEVNESDAKERPSTHAAVEHLLLFKMDPNLPSSLEQEFVDSLYTLQYHFNQVLCVSIGRIFGPKKTLDQGFTHGAVFRLASPLALSRFLSLPARREVMEMNVKPFCQEITSFNFASQVEADVEQIFKRGELFEEGVEHLVFIKAKESSSAELQSQLIEEMKMLPNVIGKDVVIQLTAGEKLVLENEADKTEGESPTESNSPFTHALVLRVPSMEKLEEYNKHASHRQVIRKFLLPVAETVLSVDFKVDPVADTPQREKKE